MSDTSGAFVGHTNGVLRVVDLTVRPPAAAHPVLEGVSFDVAPREIVGVLGPNGSGKSTLARALAGIISPERGSIAWQDGARPPRVGLVLQDPAAQAIAATVADDVAYGPSSRGMAPAQVATLVGEQLERLGVRGVAAADPLRLSGGQQQRVAIAGVTATPVDVLVLDEPTALLDPPARRELPRLVRAHAREHGQSVIWITQVPEEIGLCDRVLVLDAGVLVWRGTPHTFVDDPSIAATWALELPAASRYAHEQRATGRWPEGLRVPVTEAELLEHLAGGLPHGG